MTEFLRYPLKTYGSGENGDRLDDYLYIRVVNYVPPGLESIANNSFAFGSSNFQRDSVDAADRSEPDGKLRQIATIILPIPDKIQDNNGAEWTAGNMNPLAAVVAGSSFETAISSDPFKAALGSAEKFLRSTGDAFSENTRGVAGTTAALATNALFGQAGINQITSRATGQVFNQNTEFLFNGIQVRPAFQFTFDLTPRSREESIRIKQIIRTFKYHMAPKNSAVPGAARQVRRDSGTRQGLFVQAPDVFKLEYRMGNKEHPFLHKFKLCALTQMSVDYTGSGQHATYADGTPVHMKLSLQFQELSPIFAEDQFEYFDFAKNQGEGSGSDKGVGF